MDNILIAIRESLQAISNPHFYSDERAYQGELIAELRNRLNDMEIDDGALVQQEYQKRMKDHGFNIRPDIIIHIPFEDAGFATRDEGNFVVFELKRHATEAAALGDYEKLSSMCEILNYPLGVFINIDASETYFDSFEGDMKQRLKSFSTHIEGREVVLTE